MRGRHWNFGLLGSKYPISGIGAFGFITKNGAFHMIRFLPGRVELAIFAVLAVICAIVAFSANQRDEVMSLLAFPVFVFAAVMGLWKSGRMRAPSDDGEAA